MGIHDPSLKGTDRQRPQLLHIAGQEDKVDAGSEQGIPDGGIEFG
jgi:hypothetical protein